MEVNSKNFKISTSHNRIDVCFHRGRLEFRSGSNALQSVIDPEHPHRLQLRNLEYLMAVLIFIPDPRRILMLGTAAGSLIHFLRYYYPQAEITAVDIDTALIEQLLQKKILPPGDARLSYVNADAADFIRNCDRQYDLILVDIFSGSQSPAWLREKASIDNLRRLLSPHGGGLAYNLLIDSEHDFKRFYRDLRLVFDGHTLCLPVKDLANTIAYGICPTGAARDMSTNMEYASRLSERLDIDFMQVLSVIYNTNPAGSGVI